MSDTPLTDDAAATAPITTGLVNLPTFDHLLFASDLVRAAAGARNTDSNQAQALVPLLQTVIDPLDRHARAAIQQREALVRDLDVARAEAASLRRDIGTIRAQSDVFRDKVRVVAIRVAGEQGWCTEGLNDVLDELGLDPHVTKWQVEVHVVASQTVMVEVEADSDEAAQTKVEQGDYDLSDDLRDDDWDYSDGVEVQRVTPA